MFKEIKIEGKTFGLWHNARRLSVQEFHNVYAELLRLKDKEEVGTLVLPDGYTASLELARRLHSHFKICFLYDNEVSSVKRYKLIKSCRGRVKEELLEQLEETWCWFEQLMILHKSGKLHHRFQGVSTRDVLLIQYLTKSDMRWTVRSSERYFDSAIRSLLACDYVGSVNSEAFKYLVESRVPGSAFNIKNSYA